MAALPGTHNWLKSAAFVMRYATHEQLDSRTPRMNQP